MYIVILFLLFLIFIVRYIFELDRYISINRSHVNDLYKADTCYNKKNKVKSRFRVVISLTTTPDRIYKIIPTLLSLLTQSVKVDQIRLNVPYVSKKGIRYKIPKFISKLKNVKIYRCREDMGPITKLLPTAKDEKRSTRIIVVYDDIIYGSKLVQNLVITFEKYKGRDVITTYGCNEKDSSITRTKHYIFNTGYKVERLYGYGGFILIPSLLPKEIYDYSNAPEDAFYVDDNWISGWLSKNKVTIRINGFRTGSSFFPSWSSLSTRSLSGSENKNNKHERVVTKWFRNKL